MTHPGHTPDQNLASRDYDLIQHNAHVHSKWFGAAVRRMRIEQSILVTALAIAIALDTTVGALCDER